VLSIALSSRNVQRLLRGDGAKKGLLHSIGQVLQPPISVIVNHCTVPPYGSVQIDGMRANGTCAESV